MDDEEILNSRGRMTRAQLDSIVFALDGVLQIYVSVLDAPASRGWTADELMHRIGSTVAALPQVDEVAGAYVQAMIRRAFAPQPKLRKGGHLKPV